MRPLLAALLLGAVTTAQVAAQEAIPERRSVVSRDVDFYGADLQTLFDRAVARRRPLSLMITDLDTFFPGKFHSQIKSMKVARILLVTASGLIAARFLIEALLKDLLSSSL